MTVWETKVSRVLYDSWDTKLPMNPAAGKISYQADKLWVGRICMSIGGSGRGESGLHLGRDEVYWAEKLVLYTVE